MPQRPSDLDAVDLAELLDKLLTGIELAVVLSTYDPIPRRVLDALREAHKDVCDAWAYCPDREEVVEARRLLDALRAPDDVPF